MRSLIFAKNYTIKSNLLSFKKLYLHLPAVIGLMAFSDCNFISPLFTLNEAQDTPQQVYWIIIRKMLIRLRLGSNLNN